MSGAPQRRRASGIGRYLIAATKVTNVLLAVILSAGFAYQQYATSRDLRQTPPTGRVFTVGGLEMHTAFSAPV